MGVIAVAGEDGGVEAGFAFPSAGGLAAVPVAVCYGGTGGGIGGRCEGGEEEEEEREDYMF